MNEHLALPLYRGTFERKKSRGGAGFQPREDTKQFSEVQVFKLAKIKDDFKKDKERLKRFFDPNLIFKVELKQKVSEENFVRCLERNGVRVISPSPVGKGYWVLLAEDEDLTELTRRLRDYGEKGKYKEFHAIESFDPIPLEEKIGEQLREMPLQEGQETYLDIEIWRMEDKKLEQFLQGFKELIASKDGEISGSITTESLCLIRARITKQIFEEIIEFREITWIDRPPKPYITFNMLSVPYEEITVEAPPSKDAAAIAILGSGILSNHPLLEKAVGDERSFSLLNSNRIPRASLQMMSGMEPR